MTTARGRLLDSNCSENGAELMGEQISGWTGGERGPKCRNEMQNVIIRLVISCSDLVVSLVRCSVSTRLGLQPKERIGERVRG